MKKIIHNNLFMLKLFLKTVPYYSFFYALFIVLRSILFSLFGNVLFIQYVIKSVEDILNNHGNSKSTLTDLIVCTCIYYGFVLLFNTMIQGALNRYFTVNAEIKVKKAFTEMLFEKAHKIDLYYYDRPDYYNNLVVANNESYTRAWSTYRNFVSILESFSVLVSLFVVVFYFDSVIFFLAFVINVVTAIHQIRLNKINDTVYNQSVPLHKKLDYINRTFFIKQNAKDMKVTNIGKLFLKNLDQISQQLRDVYSKYGWKKAVITCMDSLTKRIVGDFLALFYLSYQFLVKEAYTFDVLVALWNSYNTIKGFMNGFVNGIKEMHNNSIYIQKFIDFMELDNQIISQKEIETTGTEPVSIEFKNVSFSYDKEHYILKDLSFQIDANQKVAIVGNNGAGKSTIIKLLLRLYDPDQGTIYVNGIDIRDYDVEFYRKKICNVMVQNFQQYAFSLYENVKMDVVDREKDCKEMDHAFEIVGIDKKINSLKKKADSQYSREFSEDGVVLSGGEKQKLALCRVLTNAAKMILLDEPSSALDPIAECDFNEMVMHSINERTVIIISHRLSTTKIADRILLIDQGHVAEDGTHDELMKLNGIYARMFQVQADRYK